MQHRIAGPPHGPVRRMSPRHAVRAHLRVSSAVRPEAVGDDCAYADAAYLNASPVARFIARLLMRFF